MTVLTQKNANVFLNKIFAFLKLIITFKIDYSICSSGNWFSRFHTKKVLFNEETSTCLDDKILVAFLAKVGWAESGQGGWRRRFARIRHETSTSSMTSLHPSASSHPRCKPAISVTRWYTKNHGVLKIKKSYWLAR